MTKKNLYVNSQSKYLFLFLIFGTVLLCLIYFYFFNLIQNKIDKSYTDFANFIVKSFETQTLELSRFIKSIVLWILGIILTVFVCSLTFQGILSSSVDGLTSKTAKAAVSNFIPFVGKIMGDTIDTVIGCTNILKNTFGILGVVILIGISIAPIIKISIIWFLIRLICAVCETIADPKIVKLLAGISDSYKLLFGILMSCSIMFIVGITVVLRMTSIAV